jgi:opacity protein-like surface antigen
MSVQGEASSASGSLSLFTAMLNAYVDYDLRLPIVPYVGFGVGYGRLEIDADNQGSFLKITDAASVFAWNAMVGGTMAFTTTTDFTMGYRYLMTTDPKIDGRLLASGSQRFESEYDVHEVVLGMRVNF